MSLYDKWRLDSPQEWDKPEYEFDYDLSTRENREIGGYEDPDDLLELEEMGDVYIDDGYTVYPEDAAPIHFPVTYPYRLACERMEEHLTTFGFMTLPEDTRFIDLHHGRVVFAVSVRILANTGPHGRPMASNAVY